MIPFSNIGIKQQEGIMERKDEFPGLFYPGGIVWEVESTHKYDAIREIVRRATVFNETDGLDVERFTERVIEREKLQSTGFGHGVAVAHGRTPDVDESIVALGVSRTGIEYDAIDDEPVHLLFIVANHPDKQMDYLRILSSLVALVRNSSFRLELLSCLCQEEMQKKLRGALSSRIAAQ
jgi:PTS system nitrogen regulatory IIA component